jgi:hypothetical protein
MLVLSSWDTSGAMVTHQAIGAQYGMPGTLLACDGGRFRPRRHLAQQGHAACQGHGACLPGGGAVG